MKEICIFLWTWETRKENVSKKMNKKFKKGESVTLSVYFI